jgi:hypothetical protein
MDRFSLFFAFYSLILGLAITELLSGFGRFLRSHTTHKLGRQTALLAVFTFVSITATWIDAFSTLQTVNLDVESLWDPILMATFYYLAAIMVFPSSAADFERTNAYFLQHKRFVVGMLFACEVLATYNYLPLIMQGIHRHPESFLMFYLPLNILLKGSYITLYFAKSERWNEIWLSLLILLLIFADWDNGAIAHMIDLRYGEP